MQRVEAAEPYDADQLSELGRATNMLIRQFRFPDEYEERELLLHGDSEQLLEKGRLRRAIDAIRAHVGGEPILLGSWAQGAKNKQVLAFLKDFLGAKKAIAWTGYRITCTINRLTGARIWSCWLFAKDARSATVTYSDENAPNVLNGPRTSDPNQPRKGSPPPKRRK